MRLKLAVAVAALFLASTVHADGGDNIVNVQTCNIQFAAVGGGSDTLNVTMQLDLTTDTILSDSATLTNGTLPVIPLTITGEISSPTSASFLLQGDGILMNFGDFDYSTEIYYPGLAFPQPGVYGDKVFYVDENGESSLDSVLPTSGTVDVTPAPEPSSLLLSALGISVLIGLAGRYPHEKLGPT